MSENIEELKNIIKEQKSIIDNLSIHYSSIFNHPKVGIANLDDEGNFIEVNEKFCKILGYETSELLNMSFKDITYFEDVQKDKKIHQESKDNGVDSFNMEKRYTKKDGTILYAEIFVKHNRDSNGNVLYSTGFITDITKRKKIQDTIVNQAKTMQMYLDIVDVIILGLDRKGNINLVNRKTCEILGFEEYELLGRNWFKNYVSHDNIDKVYEYFLQIMNGTADVSNKYINKIKCKDEERTISWRNKIIEDEHKNIIGIISSGEDITEVLRLEEEKKRNETALFHQSKMASMGEMLRNIAHQWRQPLSTISTAASGIKIQKELNVLSDDEFNKAMQAIVDTTQYLSHTIDDFQNFFKSDSKIKEFNCNTFFENIENLIRPGFKDSKIKLIVKNHGTCIIKGLYNELIQVVINILNNAKDAFDERNYDKKVVFMEASFANNSLYLIIKDNAGGVPEDIINRVFEPYFTTKHQSLGTGIGLYMAKDIIENHLGGKIELYNELIEYKSEKRLGAVFKLKIPSF